MLRSYKPWIGAHSWHTTTDYISKDICNKSTPFLFNVVFLMLGTTNLCCDNLQKKCLILLETDNFLYILVAHQATFRVTILCAKSLYSYMCTVFMLRPMCGTGLFSRQPIEQSLDVGESYFSLIVGGMMPSCMQSLKLGGLDAMFSFSFFYWISVFLFIYYLTFSSFILKKSSYKFSYSTHVYFNTHCPILIHV